MLDCDELGLEIDVIMPHLYRQVQPRGKPTGLPHVHFEH